MERIKKKVKFVSGSTYNIKLLLTQTVYDLGKFDIYEDENSTAVGTDGLFSGVVTITGSGSNRLEELRTYSVSPDLSLRYITSTTPTTDGLNVSLSDESQNLFIYYLGSITYTSSGSVTTFSYESNGCTPHVENKPIISNESTVGLVEEPIVDPEVFIGRQEISVFESSYRLADVKNLRELETYAGGNFFTIIENS